MALSPMMQQYMEIKEQYKDCILFFRLGDFYEMFFDDALEVSRVLELTLTGKNCGQEERAPMCGVPFHSADNYIAKLVDKGYKVAICEQTEDAAAVKGLVKREVIRVVTPGTVTNQSMLNENENNYIASVYEEQGFIGFAYCDISTGELYATRFYGSRAEETLINEISSIKAKELLFNSNIEPLFVAAGQERIVDAYLNPLPDSHYNYNSAKETILRHFKLGALTGVGLEEKQETVYALGALLSYLLETQKNNLAHITNIDIYEIGNHMSLDKATLRNLELTETLYDKTIQGSLLGVLDKTNTAMGSRKMKKWIKEPLNSAEYIKLRLNAVETLCEQLILKNNISSYLKKVYDFERLAGRIACGNANGKDLIALRNSCAVLPDIKSDLSHCGDNLIESLERDIDDLNEIYDLISCAINEEAPFTIKEGGVIKAGYSPELDNLKDSIKDAQGWIASLENIERERTGIKNLKVGFNKVFGYYIDITKSYYDLIPDNYIRKQTLVGSERFITPELKEKETLVLNAETKINKLEYELFTELRDRLQEFIPTIQRTSAAIASLDVLVSFAEVSLKFGYIKPVVHEGDEIIIEKGRHPVIEQTIKDGIFVSNDLYTDCSKSSMLLITGPNMAGKSTYMRQTALIVLMAQIGCFVPCDSAKIGTVDKIYTRIGASDNLAQGQSTFFVEMSELAYILNTCTEKSLIILDEIGRGTSTYDGLSIAWAVVEYLCTQKRARTLFATHYHELTVLQDHYDNIKNLNVSVSENDGDIVFLHKIVAGSASRSYGIHVARLAGVPAGILSRAGEKLDDLEKNTFEYTPLPAEKATTPAIKAEEVSDQLSFFTFTESPVVEKLKNLNLMEVTPSKAILILEELQQLITVPR